MFFVQYISITSTSVDCSCDVVMSDVMLHRYTYGLASLYMHCAFFLVCVCAYVLFPSAVPQLVLTFTAVRLYHYRFYTVTGPVPLVDLYRCRFYTRNQNLRACV
jgi:hypothetical protein